MPFRSVLSWSFVPIVAAAVLLLTAGGPASAQPSTDSPEGEPGYGSGFGAQILLTNSGFGLGAYYHLAVSEATSLMAEFSLGAGKDERELKFFRFGSSYIPKKANYLLMVPIQVGASHRLFRDAIEDNFRPYIQFTAGPTIGWEYPYFNDLNGNDAYDAGEEQTYDSIGALPKGDVRFGLGGTIAVGAHFGSSKRVAQGIRIGYSVTRFFEGIQLLEPQVQDAQHFFGTPTITLTFGRLI